MLWIFGGEEDMHQPALKRRRRMRSGGKATYSFCYENSCPLGYIWHQLISERGVENSVQGASFGKKNKKKKKHSWLEMWDFLFFDSQSLPHQNRSGSLRSPVLFSAAVQEVLRSQSSARKWSRTIHISEPFCPVELSQTSLKAFTLCVRTKNKRHKEAGIEKKGGWGVWLSHQTITSPLCAAEQWRCNKEFSPRTWW